MFSINLGLIGTEDSRLDIFTDYLKELAIKHTSENLVYKYVLRYEGIPMKLHVAIANGFDDLILRNKEFKHFDAIILIVDIYNKDSISKYSIHHFLNFRNLFIFNGFSALVGVDTFLIQNREVPDNKEITEFNLIQKTKELEFLYCFKIQDKKKDVIDLFNKFLSYINLRLKFLNPELFKRIKLSEREFKR